MNILYHNNLESDNRANIANQIEYHMNIMGDVCESGCESEYFPLPVPVILLGRGASAWQWPSVSRVLLTQPAVEPAVCSLSLAADSAGLSHPLQRISDSTQVPGKLVIQIINEMGVNRRETSTRGIRPGSAQFDPVTSQRL